MVFGLRVTRNFMDALGVSPFLGRGFLPEEDRPDRWHVVLLSHPYWVRRFGGNPNVVGQTILLDQVSFEIVGVLPQSFEPLSFTDAGSPPDVWAPLGYALSLPEAGRSWQHQIRGCHMLVPMNLIWRRLAYTMLIGMRSRLVR